ncbi:NAD(P)-binding protein [Mycena amicta]|nr:NAD(P)-binding protein [Mycena amicta]
MDLQLQDVHVLITGASGGIGLATARLFLEQGAKVTAHYNSNRTNLKGLLDEFGPARVFAGQAELTSEPDVARLFAEASAALGPVQVAIINHGIWPTEDVPVSEMQLSQWRATIDTNLTAAFLVSRDFLKQLKHAPDSLKEKASICFVGSTAGKYGEAGHADYAATKSALMYGFTLSLKNEIVKIAPRGRVNTVAPGWVNTPMAEEALKDPVVVYRALATTPLKKFAEPWDVATQIVVLSSPSLSGHVSGQVVMVEGGMEGRLLNRQTEAGVEAY